ncbi:MAG: nucleotidyltransferase family protein [Oceanipulchritudo sp.]
MNPDQVRIKSMISSETVVDRIVVNKKALKAFPVRHLWLFGSLARGDAEARDIDLLVEFEKPPSLVSFIQLKEKLEEILQAPVDLVSKNGCSPRFLQAIQSELRDVA